MKLNEVDKSVKTIKEESDRAGVYPVYTDEEGKTYIHMMVPSDPKYGGIKPQMGKGGIDKGETAGQAAMREGHEELGLRYDNVEKLHYLTTETITGLDTFYKLSVFIAEVKDKDNFDPYGYESSWAGWIELEEALKISRRNQLKFVKMVNDKYKNVQPLEEEVDGAAEKVEAYETLISKLQAELDKVEAEIEAGKGGSVKASFGNYKKRNILKARIQHAIGQIELITKLDVEPVGQPYTDDDPRSHGFPEASVEEWAESIAPVIKRIKTECKPYLDAIEYNVAEHRLYRGLKGTNEPFITDRVRLNDRKPQATGTHIHDATNQWFEAEFGEPFRNALFTSSNPNFAADYGNLFVVFPTGQFTFIWSPDVNDLYDLEWGLDNAVYNDNEEGGITDPLNSHVGDYMKKLGYRNSGLVAAMQQQKEIMIRTPVYYGINLSTFWKRNNSDDDSVGKTEGIDRAMKIIQGLISNEIH